MKTGFLLLLILLHTCLMAQTEEDSVRMLQPLEISDTRLQTFTTGEKIEKPLLHTIGSVESHNLGQVLMKYSAINVRSTGISGLSTASLRGSGSNHTPVFWEGINLQSSMNGTLDLTLMPLSLLDEVSLQFGSSGSLFGAGTLGGAIHLSSDAAIDPGPQANLHQQVGSFGSYYSGLSTAYRQGNTAFRLRAFHNQAENDFPYFNRFRNQEERRQHSGIRQQGLLAESYFSPARKHDLSIKYWYQDNAVEVPGVAAAGGQALATQEDVFHRLLGEWKHIHKNKQWKARSALLRSRLHYQDGRQLSARSASTSWISELENTLYLDQEQWLYLGLNHTYEEAEVDNYGENKPVRNSTSLFASYRSLPLQGLEASLGLRQSLVDGELAPLLPSFSLSYLLNNRWQLRSKVARSFNLPTFNDLYWTGGSTGNPELQPEQGWSAEIGVINSLSWKEKLSLQTDLGIYSKLMDDWIQWVPITQSRWTPVNVQQVWARGLEFNTELKYNYSENLLLRFWALYSYTLSTRKKISPEGNPRELHKQLIYTPYHQGKASAQIKLKSYEAGISWLLMGKQYTNGSNRESLPSYATFDLSAGYQWTLHRNHSLSVRGTLQNLLDHYYEVRQGFPMPGRNYQINLIYQFN
ncbi:MAG: TonB-dependent receptor plug domain-containing protein [Cyclobacteriaceae bacterium]